MERPRRSIKRPNYGELADMKVFKYCKPRARKQAKGELPAPTRKLRAVYRLNIVERDEANELVKVRYIGYDSSYDEWRPETDIVNLDEEANQEDIAENSAEKMAIPLLVLSSSDTGGATVLDLFPEKHYNLYEELLF